MICAFSYCFLLLHLGVPVRRTRKIVNMLVNNLLTIFFIWDCSTLSSPLIVVDGSI